MSASIERLLTRDGYVVDRARDEHAAIASARQHAPDVILISLSGAADELIRTTCDIRSQAGLNEDTPAIIFSVASIPEGVEEDVGAHIHLTAPENFDQLRRLIASSLRRR